MLNEWFAIMSILLGFILFIFNKLWVRYQIFLHILFYGFFFPKKYRKKLEQQFNRKIFKVFMTIAWYFIAILFITVGIIIFFK